MDNTERKTRLEMLIDQIRSHGPEHFDMSYWFLQNGKSVKTFGPWTEELVPSHVDVSACGTAACMAGHGAIVINSDPKLKAEYDELKTVFGELVAGFDPDAVAQIFGLNPDAFHLSEWHTIDGLDEHVADDMLFGLVDLDEESSNALQQRMFDTVIEYLEHLVDEVEESE